MPLKLGSNGEKPPVNARLVRQKNVAESECIPLTKFPVVLGREPTNDIVVNDLSVSRSHARLILADGGIVIEDLGSTNGIFVNGERTTSSPLAHGDTIKLGKCQIPFTIEINDSDFPEAAKTDIWDLRTQFLSPDELVTEAGKRSLHATPASVDNVLGFFQQAGKILESAFELDEVLQGILGLCFRMIPAERGFVLLAHPDTGEMTIRAQKVRSVESGPPKDEPKLSKTILDYATKQGRAILTTDAAHDDRFQFAPSIRNLEIRGAICVPLKGRAEILGAIYVDSRIQSHMFSYDDLKLLTSVGAQLGIAVENARLYESKLNAERLAAVGQAVAGLGHCIKNILNGMEGGSFILDRGLEKEEKQTIQQGWGILKRSSARLKDLVLDMLAYSKPREPVYEHVEANRVPGDVIELVKEKAAAKGVALVFEPDETLGEVSIDSKAIYRVILNLVGNAVDACPEQGGTVRVKTCIPPGDGVYQIIVTDNGTGISPENLAKLGRAFFSTKGSQGTGLGLSVSYKIVAEHKGTMAVASEVGQGTTFTVTLPLRPPAV